MPQVSVCIPTYNGREFLRDCIQSVRAQSFTDFEAVVCDDRSSDSTLDLAKEIAAGDSRFRFYGNSERLGLAGNWNFSIGVARCKWIKFLLQDDLLDAECLRSMLDIAESRKGIGFLFCRRRLLIEASAEGSSVADWLRQYEDLASQLGPIQIGHSGAKLLHCKFLLSDPINKIGEPTCVMVRRELFDRVGLFNEKMKQLVDAEMWFRLMSRSDMAYIREPMASFRIHAGQASMQDVAKDFAGSDYMELIKTLSSPKLFPLLHPRVRYTIRNFLDGAGAQLPQRPKDRMYSLLRDLKGGIGW
jgi:glycosyltransferase involved in cell wall biosynthesis